MNTHLRRVQQIAEKAQQTVARGEKLIQETEAVLRDSEIELREIKGRRARRAQQTVIDRDTRFHTNQG